MPRCHLALGGNLGPVREHFHGALLALSRAGCTIEAVSSLYRTAPATETATGEFLNAAAVVESALSAEALLNVLQSIEQSYGRTREVRWESRTLDLDLIFYGSEIIDTPRLTVPHPWAWCRRFVLEPLAELTPDFIHPVRGLPVSTLRDRLLVRPLTIALAGSGAAAAREQCAAIVSDSLTELELYDEAATITRTGRLPTFVVWLGAGHGDPAAATIASRPPVRISPDIGAQEFADLPLVSRLDATRFKLPVRTVLQHLVEAVLGKVEAVAAPSAWWPGLKAISQPAVREVGRESRN